MHALVNEEVVSVVKVAWNVFHSVTTINVKTKVLCKYSRYIAHFLNKITISPMLLHVFLLLLFFWNMKMLEGIHSDKFLLALNRRKANVQTFYKNL